MPIAKSSLFVVALLASGAAQAQSPGKPTDPQIAHVAYTAGEIDIKAAQLALSKSKNTQVTAFAEDMVRDHEAVNKQALALLAKLKVKPEDNATSRALEGQARTERQKLASLKGVAFNKAYARNEVAYHRQVNDVLRTTLIPSARNPELKSLLSTGLMLFEGHQQHAEHLVQALR
jgi:putative membrane protein